MWYVCACVFRSRRALALEGTERLLLWTDDRVCSLCVFIRVFGCVVHLGLSRVAVPRRVLKTAWWETLNEVLPSGLVRKFSRVWDRNKSLLFVDHRSFARVILTNYFYCLENRL